MEVGSYNALMQNQPLYNSNKHTFESSHALFRSVFSEGFAWELLEVFSGKSKLQLTVEPYLEKTQGDAQL